MTNVTVYSTKTGTIKKVQTSATTWGDLKTQLEEADLLNSGMKAIDKTSKMTYEHAQSPLPTSDFTIFTVPVKTKSGCDYELDSEDVEDLICIVVETIEERGTDYVDSTIRNFMSDFEASSEEADLRREARNIEAGL